MTETRGYTSTPERGRPTGRDLGVFGRLALFYRQIIAELRKVIWPTRNELVTYTVVVIVFVSIMITILFTLDYLFGKAVLAIFG